jgi:hypothetical protein
MSIATGVAKRVAYKKEVTWNTAPGASGAQSLRRVSSLLALDKATYASAEIRGDYQVADFRHGMRSVKGALKGELSAGTWKDFFAAVCRKAFAAVTPIASLSLTIAASGSNFTVARGSGSWITDGVKVGDVIRITAGSVNAANLNKNLFVLAEVAATLTVAVLNGVAMVAEGPIASCTVAVTGKKTMMAVASQTDDSFSIEHWYSDISQSELFTGCKVQQMDLALPASGMSDITLDFLGGNVTTAASQYFTSPTAETTYGILAGVNGLVQVQGATVGLLTALQLSCKGNMTAEPIVGSNVYADITEGRMEVSGQFSVLFQDATFRDYFLNETEIAIAAVLSASPSATADFLGFSLPRVKVGAATRDDGEKGLILTCPFTALLNTAGGAATASENSTLVIQDSQA